VTAVSGYDLVVIGAGAGGVAAARFAAEQLGLRVAAIEPDRIGADRVGAVRPWSGSVPSNTLIASARVARAIADAGRFGIEVTAARTDLDAVWARIATVRDEVARSGGGTHLLRTIGVDVFTGTAEITGPRTVGVDGPSGSTELDTRFVLVSTGSRPTIPELPGLDGIDHLTSDTLFDLHRPPASLVMIGGGPSAVEIGQAMSRLGVRTTVVESSHRLVPGDEPELADRLGRLLRSEGVELRLATTATAVRRGGEGVVVETTDGEFTAAGLLVACGRTANVDQLRLERFGIPVSARGVEVDGRNRTLVPSIYVVGDAAAGRPRYVHTAEHDAVTAVRDMFLPGRRLPASLVAWCTFTDPELAGVGLTASTARERHGRRAVTVLRHDLADDPRARADGTTEGMIVVVAVRNRIVGAHVLAPSAGEMIHELATAIRFGIRIDELAELVHVDSTLSAGIGRLGRQRSNERARALRPIVRLSRLLG
jgi:pyruvate/2-oxoglutarate dehydrogenase complex dihydrolipoamide dehydrogenase (E3) component